MGTTYRVQHCFQGQGGTSKDMYCNQFYFWSDAHTAAGVATWGGLLATYVHQLFVTGGPNSLSRYYSYRAFGNGGVTKIYDVGPSGATLPAGSPIFVISDESLVPADDYLADCPNDQNLLPEEVALCLSYQAAHVGGDLPRRRGRIYYGPFNILALGDGAGSGGPVRPAQGLVDAIVDGAVDVQAAAAANDFEWRVFSPSDGFAFKIINFSCDDAFDTVRGRGTAPATRYTAPIA